MQGYVNPVNDFYFRNAQMQQPNYGQLQFPPQQNQVPQVNSRFVTNIEEAKAAMIDPLSYNLYLDTNSGKIYLKKLGNNGQSEFLCYGIEETNAKINTDPMQEINARLLNIENYLGELKNDKSVSNNADVIQSTGNVATTVAEQNESNAEIQSAGFSKNARIDKWQKRS